MHTVHASRQRLFLVLFALAGLSASALGQTPTVVLREGQHVLGAARVRGIPKLSVSDHGFYFAHVDTTDPDPAQNSALVLNGFLAVPEGAALGNYAGASVDRFISIDCNNSGSVGCVLGIRGVTQAKGVGLFLNTLLVAQTGASPRASFAVGTRYTEFHHARLNDRLQLLALGRVDDPTIGTLGRSEGVLWRTTVSTSGNVLLEEALVVEGRALPSTGELVQAVGRADHPGSIALNQLGEWMSVARVNAAANRDSVILQNGAVLVREGDLAVDGVRKWGDLDTAKVDLNDLGNTLFLGWMEGGGPDNAALVLDGRAVVQEGVSFPAIAPHVVTSFGTTPVFVSNSGDVYWYGVTSDPDARRDEYYFRNLDVVLREGDANGADVFTGLASVAYAMDVSDSGRFLIAKAVESGLDEVLVLADFGSVLANTGCAGNAAMLSKVAGDACIGDSFTLAFDSAQPGVAMPLVVWSIDGAPFGACGALTPAGERLIEVAPAKVFARVLGTLPAPGSGQALARPQFVIDVPNDPALVDWKVYGQAVHGVPRSGGGVTLELSNAVIVEIGA